MKNDRISSTTPEQTTYLTEKMDNKVRLNNSTRCKDTVRAERRRAEQKVDFQLQSKHGPSLQQGLVFCWIGLATPDCHIRNRTAITCAWSKYLPFLPITFVIGGPEYNSTKLCKCPSTTCLLPAMFHLLSSALCRCIQEASDFISGQALDFI